MTLKIYTVSGAPRPWRVLLGLMFKGLPYESVLLKASEKEHKSEPFLSINPRGTVPVLTDGSVTLRDSIAALAWLDRAYPDRPLFGTTPDAAAEIWQHTTELSDYLRKGIDGVLSPVFFQGADRATPDLAKAADLLTAEVSRLDGLLAGKNFVCGQAPSAADAIAFPELRLLQRANDTKPEVMKALNLHTINSRFPAVAQWVNRIEALPGYAQTRPPHWQAAA